jgi:inosine triphosphate pyrophosphatase
MAKRPIFVTGNQHKADYLARLLDVPLEHHKLSLDELQDVDPKVIVEHKVRQAYASLNKPVLVEDVSLGFTALAGLPGPFIKFFLEANNGLETLCRMLDGFDDRSAYATVTYGYFDGQDLLFFSGGMDGNIATQPRGTDGYGWDAIFEPEGYGGLTRAELSDEQGAETYRKLRDFDGLRDFLNS